MKPEQLLMPYEITAGDLYKFYDDKIAETFTECFYEECPYILIENNLQTRWGYPWLWAADVILKGNNVREKARNLWMENKEDILPDAIIENEDY